MVQFFVNPFPNEKNSDSSKFKAFADDNFELDENGRKLSKRVGNTVGKGAISPFPTVFSKDLYSRHVKAMACWEGVNWTENIVGKGENYGYYNFLLFIQCFQKDSFPGLLKL